MWHQNRIITVLSGKITQNTGKVGNFRQMLFIIFSDISMNCVLLAKMDQVFSSKSKTIKHTAKVGENTTKVLEFCQSGKVGTMLTQKIHCLKREWKSDIKMVSESNKL